MPRFLCIDSNDKRKRKRKQLCTYTHLYFFCYICIRDDYDQVVSAKKEKSTVLKSTFAKKTTSGASQQQENYDNNNKNTNNNNNPKPVNTITSSAVTKATKQEEEGLKNSREATFRDYLNKDGTLDNLTRALDDLLRSNTKPDSPADWLVDRLSIDYGNKLRKAQENFNEQLKENDKLRERLEKSRRFVQRLQEEIEDLTNKLEEEKGMAEAVATRAMLEPQELEMLKDELKEVMEDANEMADLIREYERREEERLALKSAKKELAKDKQDFRAQSPSSSDASSRGLPRFNEIQEKVRKQHSSAALADGDAHKKPPSPITASDSDYKQQQQQQQQQQQRVENDRVRKLIMSPSVRITESEGKMMF